MITNSQWVRRAAIAKWLPWAPLTAHTHTTHDKQDTGREGRVTFNRPSIGGLGHTVERKEIGCFLASSRKQGSCVAAAIWIDTRHIWIDTRCIWIDTPLIWIDTLHSNRLRLSCFRGGVFVCQPGHSAHVVPLCSLPASRATKTLKSNPAVLKASYSQYTNEGFRHVL